MFSQQADLPMNRIAGLVDLGRPAIQSVGDESLQLDGRHPKWNVGHISHVQVGDGRTLRKLVYERAGNSTV